MHAGRSDTTAHNKPAPPPAPIRGLGLADMRAANRDCILEALARDGPLSRVALARRIGLSRTTVSTIVADLLREGRVHEEGTVPSPTSGGRRAILLRLSDASPAQVASSSSAYPSAESAAPP
jgi:predicted ArsR family transcriptional regulator